MSVVQEHHFWWALGLILVTLALTIFVFRHRLFDRGYRKGTAASPNEVRLQNPPDGQAPQFDSLAGGRKPNRPEMSGHRYSR